MDWQAAGDWQGDKPGRDARLPALPELLASFGHGGAWETAAPSAALAMVLEAAAGPDFGYAEAGTDALVGIAGRWAALESWAAAGMMGALRAMMRDDDAGAPLLSRRTDLPGGWDDSLNYEIAAALAMGPQSAGSLARLAWTLGMRLPGIGRLLAEGTLTRSKARAVAQVFEPLTEDEMTRAEALIVDELEGKTYPQVERLAWRAALAVAPDVAERRRRRAERAARVTVFREEAGTVGLSGRDLPAAGALAGHANVVARARAYELSGAFSGRESSWLQAQAYLDLLSGVPAADRIAFAAATVSDPPDPQDPQDPSEPPESADEPGPEPVGEPGPRGPGDGGPQRPGGSGGGDSPGRRPGGGDQDDDDILDPDPGDYDDDIPEPDLDADDSLPDLAGTGASGGMNESGSDRGDDKPGPGGMDDQVEPEEPQTPDQPTSALAEVTVPLATLQGTAQRAGDNRLLGPLDPALARQLAEAAARSPHSRWEVIVTDEHGYATGHGIARPAPRRPGRPQPPGPGPGPGPAPTALPARVSITITETFLRTLATQAATPQSPRPDSTTRPDAPPGKPADGRPRSGLPPGDWQLTPAGPGTWTLTLPGGRQLTVRFDVVPTHDCDHRYQTDSYAPGDKLRRLVQVRDLQCTFPTCSRPARESDFEHAVPYDKGGKTDACNAGMRSRRCHQVKQSPGWSVTQPKPGWHRWTTPTGRSYTEEPWRYIA